MRADELASFRGEHVALGASTRSIAQRVDAHQPQINYHFASKEALWAAAVDHLFERLTTELGDLLRPLTDSDTPAELAATDRAWIDRHADGLVATMFPGLPPAPSTSTWGSDRG